MKLIYKIALFGAGACALVSLYLFLTGDIANSGIPLVCFFIFLALGFRGSSLLSGFSFTVLIFAAVSISLYYPAPFIQIGSFKMNTLIVPLLQIIMFGMGTAMSIADFYGVIKMPKGVIIGVICQFLFMPLIGFILASLFQFSPEIAAGVVLIGSSPSGLASNVMAYLAKANVALSVTLTAVATCLAPIMTPLMMKLYAGAFVPIEFWSMMLSIIKIVIIPITLGLVFNQLFHGKTPWLDKLLPKVSMVAIGLIITVITASGRDNLLSIGILLILTAIIHNLLGYFLGYWSCRLIKMKEQDCRTIALEVGMQNGGLASGIALEMGKVATIGLAPAVFGPWMNISGSSLATWWRNKKIKTS